MSSQNNNPLSFQIHDHGNALDQDGVARFILSETGKMIYANEDFYALADISDTQNIARKKYTQFFTFAEELGPEKVEGGQYPLILKKSKNIANFHFDWIQGPGSEERFLIASEINDLNPDMAEPDAGLFQQALLQVQGLKISPDIKENKKDITLDKAMGSLNDKGDLRHFLNMSNDLMAVTDENANLIRVNSTFKNFMGLKEKSLNEYHFLDLFNDADRPYIRNCLQSLNMQDETAGIVDFEARMIGENGQAFWMEWRLQQQGDYIYGVGRDMTAVKKHEDELETREKQLLEAEIIGRMGRWHWVVGQDSIEWSDQIFRIFGVSRSEFQPTIDGLNSMVHRRDVGRVVQAFQRAIIEENDYDMEFRIVRPGGDIRYIRCEGRCERDSEGDVVALYGIMQDMTERMLYERELKEAKDAAERAYAAKSQFLANMSHELRTPLNAIIGFSEMMQRQLLGPIGTEKYLDYIAGIRESGEHLLDLISDILDMSKIEAGKHKLDLEELNVTKTLKLAVHMMEGRAQESCVKILTDQLNDENLSIVADRRAFMQIILNLLSNAVKFSNEEGRIWIECVERPEFLSIRIIDEGIGIPANKLNSIMRPFEQVSSSYSRNHEGSGLGLAITKELVEMHGGNLSIDSRQNEGTTVTVRMPYKAENKD
ncbi:MAG: ATP-binding protein [Alphaproteobacteria bacterium]